jgi:dynein heavy chain
VFGACVLIIGIPFLPPGSLPSRDTTLKLNRKIEDLEDVRGIMSVLKEVREKESEIDNLIGPIEEMYGLLLR